jgi:hypothetical protein
MTHLPQRHEDTKKPQKISTLALLRPCGYPRAAHRKNESMMGDPLIG